MSEPLLLIVGGESDPNTQRVVDQAHLRSLPYHFWDTDAPHARRIAWDFDSPHIDLGDVSLQPTAVFVRYNVFAGDPAHNHAVYETILAYSLAWPQLRLLNRSVVTDVNSKARNLAWARQAGLPIPETLVMADLTPLATMPRRDDHVIKPLGGGNVARSAGDVGDELAVLADLEPQFVQNRLRGENLRLFWIDGHTHCFHLQSEAVDYREDATVQVTPIAIPAGIHAPAQRLIKRIGFDYCALDFRCTRRWDNPVFLEINSFPMFVRFDDAIGNRLVDALLDFLLPELRSAP